MRGIREMRRMERDKGMREIRGIHLCLVQAGAQAHPRACSKYVNL